MAAGLALWHVDENLVLNGGSAMLGNLVNSPSFNGTGHYGVDLIEADGIQSGAGSGDLFVDGTSASGDETNTFKGRPSGMTAAVTSGTGTSLLHLSVVSFLATPSTSISKLVNYPNPAGDPSRYPVRPGAPAGTVTTLVVQLSRPVSTSGDIDFDLYDLAGTRVRAVPGACFSLNAGASSNGKWVYECDWDGKNDGGTQAVSGVYVYRAKVGTESKGGKLVIVR
jgi:hypothetical protein